MTEPAEVKSPFLIAGVGASAGGLAPTAELLGELGAEPGIALVIIHHLDPTQPSSLVEILSRATPMPVVAATNDDRVAPNRVYVIPPNAGLLIDKGVLKVVPRQDERGIHLPINRFFESLALDCDGLAAGVVLSGTGFDGTEGVKAIKREGGIALAQDGTAQYSSMPESAVATGSVDVVLPPSGLARELIRLGAHATAVRETAPAGADDRVYEQILAAMQKRSGVDFASYKHTTIRRRLQRRLLFHGLSSMSAYAELLQSDASEVAALCEDALIHVTGFFRDPEAFEALRTLVFPRLFERRPNDLPVRIWVPGCSTGEEVYSIAISLLEFLEETHRNPPIKFFGTDLSLPIIEKARAGRYSESIETEVSEGRLRRFFVKDEIGYRIRPDVRDLCVFAKHDVARDPPFSAMDLVACRNVMIYLGPELQERVVSLLHYSLRDPGFLWLGTAETIRAFTGFLALDEKNKIYARTSGAKRVPFDFTTPTLELATPGPGPLDVLELGARGRSAGASDVHREADRLVLAEFAPPGVVVAEDLSVVQFRGRTGPFLEHAPGVATLDLLRMVREELRLPLRHAIDRARATQSPVRESVTALPFGEPERAVTLEVIPFVVSANRQRFFLVLFSDVDSKAAASRSGDARPATQAGKPTDAGVQDQLAAARQYLESVIEQLEAANEDLKAANEEIISSNEELRSTNEELQIAKEELQATNEELRTLNDEMRDRSAESKRLSDDLANVLTSTEIPIIILGRDLRLRRFTPAAARVFELSPADLGRPLDAMQRLAAIVPDLSRLVPEGVEQLRPSKRTIQDAEKRFYDLSVRPYVTVDGRIDGTVIVARDVDAEKRNAEALLAARKYAESIVDTVREGLVVLDGDLRVTSANPSFEKTFGVSSREIAGRRFDELGQPAFGAPSLQTLLEGLRAGAPAEGLRLQDGAEPDTRTLWINGRCIESTELVLLAFDDVTESERARVQRAEVGFREILAGAPEGIFLVEASGKMGFVNEAAAQIFGYEPEELVGQPVDLLVSEALRDRHGRHRADYAAAPSRRRMGREGEIVGRRKNGAEVAIDVALSVLKREDGLVSVAFVRDVTERRESDDKIRAYQDQLQRTAFDAAITEERERRRIAVDLHDRFGQVLALAEIKLASVRGELAGENRAAVDDAVALVHEAISAARTLMFDLSPPVLYDLGLKQALAWLSEDFEKRHGMKVEVGDDGSEVPLDDDAKAIVFRAVRELLMNVLKHAQVPSARVSLRCVDDHLEVEVEDRGAGFVPDAPVDRSKPGGFGLLSTREQIRRLGGQLTVESAPRQGTVASVRIPLPENAAPSDRAAHRHEGTGSP